jgi:hypothetical protein
MYIFHRYQVHAKDIKCPLEWWRKYETMFPTVAFLERTIGSQIEMERIFSLARILTNLKNCCLQSNNLKFLIFVSKSWPNDATMGCKTPIKLIDFELDLEQKLDNFESLFE